MCTNPCRSPGTTHYPPLPLLAVPLLTRGVGQELAPLTGLGVFVPNLVAEPQGQPLRYYAREQHQVVYAGHGREEHGHRRLT